METTTTPAPAPANSKTTPKDFFLWLGAIIALYGSVTSLIALKFQYIDYLFPDPLAGYGDPYGGGMRVAMAALIVLVPTMIVLFWLIRGSIVAEPGKASIWVRRWALGLTLFIATATILIDLVTLINTFLGGEITVRFALKVLTVLVVALVAFAYFFLDIRGYWVRNGGRARIVAIVAAIGALIAVGAAFFIIGSPAHVRALRLDDYRVSDLQNLQGAVVSYYQQKQALPKSIEALADPLTGVVPPMDPETGDAYGYEATGPLSFKLCAVFTAKSAPSMKGRGGVSYPAPLGISGANQDWQHEAGETCFERTIDPAKFPPLSGKAAQ